MFHKISVDLQEKFAEAVTKISDKSIERGMLRAYSRDNLGDYDESLIPESIDCRRRFK